ncbi:MAG: DNA mismatch repair endonuclease MutL [Rhodothermales bacterium]|nr:DNA mismatch repair endonuclease MutL [Rhodothermales bacterium]
MTAATPLPPDAAPDGLVRVLPDSLANKIAAGEVVQRPASVLKELMENALDAGAGQVTVLLRKAGSELVQVIDDGCGMGPSDAASCFGRHATSKIRDIEDLERLHTLGFRGEALASIAAVAQVELKTKRQADTAGTCLRLDGGNPVEHGPCATPDGTSVAVRNLFFNVPARRNFLKSPATEFKHLVETFQYVALSNPEVGFTLVHDGAEVYRLPPSDAGFEEALRLRLLDLVGERHEGRLVGVAETTSYLTLRGFVGPPEAAKKSRGEQYLFVNGRYVRDRSLEHAVAAAFGDLLPRGARPLFALFLTLDPRHVDVNVHPTKTEVKFDDERGVYGFVRAVVKKALGDADLVPDFGDGSDLGEAAPAPVAIRSAPVPTATPAGLPTPAPFQRERPAEAERGAVPSPGPLRTRTFEVEAGSHAEAAAPPLAAPIPSGARPLGPAEAEAEGLDLESEPPVWQLHHRWIVTPIRSGLLLLDQQAAHERVLYEQALTALDGGLAASQQLLFPVTLEFPPGDYELVEELLPDLRVLGFDITPFSGRTMKVQGVPSDVKNGRERRILEEVLEQYKAFRDTFELSGRDNLAKSLARRSAYRPGDPLNDAQARSLIDQLFGCRMPYADPHGRPTMVKITTEELERRFSRG